MNIKGFKNFLQEDVENITEAKFSIEKIGKAIDLIASIGSKYASAKFGAVTFKPWAIMDFKKSDGTEGTGKFFMNSAGEKLRIGYANVPGLKSERMEINSIDYWSANNFNLGEPTRSVVCYPHYNVVNIAREVMEYAITGKMPKEENLSEELIYEMKASQKLLDYFEFKGVSKADIKSKTAYLIKKDLTKSGLWDEDEYRGFKNVDKKETNSVQLSIKASAKALSERPFSDPEYVFDDIIDLTTIVAKGHQNSLIIAGQAGVGKCVYAEMELEITGLD